MKKSSKENKKQSISLSDGSKLSHQDLESMLIAVNGTIHGKTDINDSGYSCNSCYKFYLILIIFNIQIKIFV